MAELLDRAFEIARALSAQAPDELARLIMDAASTEPDFVEMLSAQEEASFDESIAQ